MLVLGIGGFLHDYNCGLIDCKKQRVAICEAERLSRRKHHVLAEGDDLLAPVRKCCRDLGCRINDIDTVVLGHTDAFACKAWFKKALPNTKVVEVDHHLCHAASAFFSSPYSSATIVSIDGFGDGSSGLLAKGDGNRIEEIARLSEDDSIGLEYLRATVHLGLGGYGAEGKTQGLAPYGEPTVFEDYMNEIEITPQGTLRLSSTLRQEGSLLAQQGGYLNTMLLNNAFLANYCPRRIVPEPLTETHMNLAASIQKVLEHVVSELCHIAKHQTQMENLVLSGGVSMNSSLNGRLLQRGEFQHIFGFPMASDRGTGIGAALYHVHQQLDLPRFFKLTHVFYGNQFRDRDAVKAFRKAGIRYAKSNDIVGEAVRALGQGKIVGWFQGRSEAGARALGHRSILADPRQAEMKDMINEKVKHREWFRPFAPAVLDNRASEYFDVQPGVADLSYMTFTVPATDDAAAAIPAVVHVDKTSRIQTVTPERNPLYARLIEGFGDETGVPVILNTSFNDQGEPIVETPDDAVTTFLNTGMDVLCIGNVLGEKA